MQEIESFNPYEFVEQDQQAAAESPEPVKIMAPAQPAQPADDEPFNPYEAIERELI